jgi:hypothetical protein
MSYLIETLWLNRGMMNGLKKHYEIVKNVSDELNDVEFIGLFRPKTEPWNWAIFHRVKDLKAMVKLDQDISEVYGGWNRDITNSITRVYSRLDSPKESITISELEGLDLLVHENYVCEGINLGINEIADVESGICREIEGIVYLGMYAPWSLLVNWSPIFLTDSISKYVKYDAEFSRSYARPASVTLTCVWLYERFTP